MVNGRSAVPYRLPPWHEGAMQSGPGAILLSILMIAAFLLGAGGAWMIVKAGDTKKGLLMLTAAAVLIGNVLIWTV